MAKRKQKARRVGQSSVALQQNGLKAFQRNDYTAAITTWEKIQQQSPRHTPVAALAEAYFRRGVKQLQAKQLEQAAKDLQKAVKLQPGDAVYTYYKGRVAQQQGRLDEAIAAYQRVRQASGEMSRRTAYPLAVALQQQGNDVTQVAVWKELEASEREALLQLQAFHRRPYTVTDDASPLWQGLVAYDDGRLEEARQDLTHALGDETVAPLAHYYLGAIAAREENWEKAAHHWTAARAAGFDSQRLGSNLGELYHRLAEDRLVRGNAEGALAAADEASRHKDTDKPLDELIGQAEQHLAYQAAQRGDWDTALSHWELAQEQAGSSFRLAYNLALAYEKLEDYYSAAELWREALRRRPRRADHPDAVSDEQVSRLWQHTAEAYVRSEEYEEAVNVYRHAVKWQPENVTIRMELAQSLLNNGSFRAAENELRRILERDPNYVPALLRLGEVISQSGYWWHQSGPVHYWTRVLAIEPENEAARHYLVEHYQNRAEEWLQWQGNYERALEAYGHALQYEPENAETLIAIGYCHLMMGDEDQGRSFIERALQHHPADLQVRLNVVTVWLEADRPETAWEFTLRVETGVPDLPPHFYVSIASDCFRNQHPDFAQRWLDRAVEKAPPDVPVLAMIGEMATFAPGAEAIARSYLEKSLQTEQTPGQAHLMLGILAARQDDDKTAQKHWRKAERIARQTDDPALQQRIDHARSIFGGPLGLMSRLMSGIDPNILKKMPLPDFLDDLFDEVDDDFFYDD